MAKRFTDTMKWDKMWYRKLDTVNKCFWNYICDRCDHSGIWEVDFETAGYFIGVDLDIVSIKDVFKKQYVELSNGKKWFLQDFVDFQYGELNPANRVHQSVMLKLKKEGANKGLLSPYQGVKDKDKDKDMDKDKVKEVKKCSFDFDIAWSLYPNKEGRKLAKGHFNTTIKTKTDYDNLLKAIENYKKSEKVLKGYVKMGSTFFNDWSAWVNPTYDMMGVKNSLGLPAKPIEKLITHNVICTVDKCKWEGKVSLKVGDTIEKTKCPICGLFSLKESK